MGKPNLNIEPPITPVIPLDQSPQRETRGRKAKVKSAANPTESAIAQVTQISPTAVSEDREAAAIAGGKAKKSRSAKSTFAALAEPPENHRWPAAEAQPAASTDSGRQPQPNQQLLAQFQQYEQALGQMQTQINRLNQQATHLQPAAPAGPQPIGNQSTPVDQPLSAVARAAASDPTRHRLPDWAADRGPVAQRLAARQAAAQALAERPGLPPAGADPALAGRVSLVEKRHAHRLAQELRSGIAGPSPSYIGGPQAAPDRPIRYLADAKARSGDPRRLRQRSGCSSGRRSALSWISLIWQQVITGLPNLVPIPRGRWQKGLDAGLWILGAVLLRLASRVLLWGLPGLTGPLYLLMLAPAGLAAYLAFVVPNSNTAVIYRLLLLTLGLFIGGKL
jgi:hypothetical protein